MPNRELTISQLLCSGNISVRTRTKQR